MAGIRLKIKSPEALIIPQLLVPLRSEIPIAGFVAPPEVDTYKPLP
jgi:hypothetical protein